MSADDPDLAATSGGLAVPMWRTTPAVLSTKRLPRMFRFMPARNEFGHSALAVILFLAG